MMLRGTRYLATSGMEVWEVTESCTLQALRNPECYHAALETYRSLTTLFPAAKWWSGGDKASDH